MKKARGNADFWQKNRNRPEIAPLVFQGVSCAAINLWEGGNACVPDERSESGIGKAEALASRTSGARAGAEIDERGA
jgi:hypothetical protein